jgi:hypothetical protein
MRLGVMTLESAIDDTRTRFANNGRFSLLPGESINKVARREKVPNGRGIYIIFRCDDSQRPLYIGKAGTINQNGTWKKQDALVQFRKTTVFVEVRLQEFRFRYLPNAEALGTADIQAPDNNQLRTRLNLKVKTHHDV